MVSRWLRRSALPAAAAMLLAVLTPTSAWANTFPSINPGNVPTNAADYKPDEQVCEDNKGGGPYPGMDVWVFTLPGNHAVTGDFVSVTAQFDTNLDTVADTTKIIPTDGGAIVLVGVSHAWIVLPAGWVLIDASAEVTGVATQFNLSHTCPASDQQSPSSVLTSKVHLADHTVIDNTSQGPNGATVHDELTLIVSGITEWTGTLTENYFTSNDCTGDPAATTSFSWSNTDPSVRDDVLPQGPLGAGDYSYQESFNSDLDALDVVGACEPFILTEESTTTTVTTTTTDPGCDTEDCLPTTGVSLTGFIAAGLALLIGGAALIFARRRRDLAVAGPAGATVDLGSDTGTTNSSTSE